MSTFEQKRGKEGKGGFVEVITHHDVKIFKKKRLGVLIRGPAEGRD